MREKGASTETILEGFFNLLGKVLERDKEEGLEMAIVDLYAFEYFVEVEYTDWRPRIPGYLSILKNPPPNMQPKRQKLALVPEDQFFAQHPGSSTIKVSVPDVDDGQVIGITVQSLSENVASLKEKIAKKLELRGKAGVLEGNKSLAHYNVGAGDILTLSL
ncbi:hypothetical protein CARUB_v10002157mg [Capsella rubella]|uniref:Ubiquitin-like domain-containing protein n=1 Tax=Capsella rubella TaxID=81985 RepID=R0GXU0_9BRAS|nr:probable splicing factor 3A subunit 1 [Capsella rubella]EOA21719.1 hypothetical protein CARUB_v10002157mg [Capsella rubella]